MKERSLHARVLLVVAVALLLILVSHLGFQGLPAEVTLLP